MTVLDVFRLVVKEYQRSVLLHGDWSDYSTDRMMGVIIHELMVEAGEAEKRGDITGEHGLVNELVQVASCCMKAAMVLSVRPEGHLAGASRTAGAHSCSAGFALPASPSLHQEKESAANSPEGGSDVPR